MKQWPHQPSRTVSGAGTYIVTAGTYNKLHLFHGKERLDLLHDHLLGFAEDLGWSVEAWAVFSNHYHVVGSAPDDADPVGELTKRVHGKTAVELNRMDGSSGRQVWFRRWDTKLTFQRSYFARLAYVHNNPVKHELVRSASDYPWCSATWFRLNAEPAHYETVSSFDYSQVRVEDNF